MDMEYLMDFDTTEAVCSQIDPDLYFPDNLAEAMSRNVTTIKNLCFQCPLVSDCFEHAMRMTYLDDHGVWGASTAYERKQMKISPSKLEFHRKKIRVALTKQNEGAVA